MLTLNTPLRLGHLTIPSRIIQGPLAGYSCAPFRAITHQYGRPAFSFTEMISAQTLLHKSLARQKRLTARDAKEGLVCYQLSATRPDDLATATQIVTDMGADFINLNCGCPVKKIRSKGSGSKLLATPHLLAQLIEAMRKNTHVPISIKIRVDAHSDEYFNREVADVVTATGVDFLIVHGRHWRERYDAGCHYEDIEQFVEWLSIPVIGNGDISTPITLERMLQTGCAGVMVSRASVGRPWLLQQLVQPNWPAPSGKEISELFLHHVTELARLLESEKQAVLQARKLGKYYARAFITRSEFCMALNDCDTLAQMEKLISRHTTIP